ncbi:neutral/alkaline non-lysosomal ceramidase N-terminal domain-containing protein, partial [Nocardia puris]|uniref:neutral/alkaline non-lysosomal ceramidase N-terminal domain-containing protein n=2 Tax=Nocardia TaxID=1817 RepID=UPI00189302D8
MTRTIEGEQRAGLDRRTLLARSAVGTVALATVGTVGQGVAAAPALAAPDSGYRVGLGISDITGPAAECGMMGYSQFGQDTAGIHLRPRARAFIFEAGAARVVFAVAENGM